MRISTWNSGGTGSIGNGEAAFGDELADLPAPAKTDGDDS